ncbi:MULTISPECIES: cytoplasmic protein [Streptomycetaceae]|uniref:cytoplasmic protein n=1 Tax=Streptomycetaceae TaxID=2062 RepID=UPI000939FB69|nr:cytoplasmic protein [Streptomyces sp. CB02056]OKI05510.1 cytoplasmic protein [Streptomyces sp. CB02056]
MTGQGDAEDQDPTVTDPDLYRIVFENARVRVLEYRDTPGVKTGLHYHPDSVMVVLSTFRRRMTEGDTVVEVERKRAPEANWLPARTHVGENIGTTDTHIIFVELK